MSDREKSAGAGAREPEDPPKASEHLNIKVTDNNNEVFFKIKRTTALAKLMNAFCERQGKTMASVRFLFDGTRVQAGDSPESVRIPRQFQTFRGIFMNGAACLHMIDELHQNTELKPIS